MNIAEATLKLAKDTQVEIHSNAWFDGTRIDRFLRVNIDNVNTSNIYDYLYAQQFTMLSMNDILAIRDIAQKEENESFYLLKKLGLKKSQRILIREFNSYTKYNNPVKLARDCGAPEMVIDNIRNNYMELMDIVNKINTRIYNDLKRQYNLKSRKETEDMYLTYECRKINIDTIIIAPEKVLQKAGISVVKDDPVIISRVYSTNNIHTTRYIPTCVVLGAWGAEKKVLDALLELKNLV